MLPARVSCHPCPEAAGGNCPAQSREARGLSEGTGRKLWGHRRGSRNEHAYALQVAYRIIGCDATAAGAQDMSTSFQLCRQ